MKTSRHERFMMVVITLVAISFWAQGCSDVEFGKSQSANVGLGGVGDKDPLGGDGSGGTGGDGTGGAGGDNTAGTGGDGTGGGGGGTGSDPGGSGGGGGGTGGDGTGCVPLVQEINKHTKFLFVMDASSSNAATSSVIFPDATIQVPATDPQKTFRHGALSRFFERYKAKTNFEWGLITFADFRGTTLPKARALVNGGNDQAPLFTKNLTQMESAITAYKSVVELAATPIYTPYHGAMDMAAKAIREDRDFSNVETQYFVIMITDGMPTDGQVMNGVPDTMYPVFKETDVSKVTTLAPSRVKLSTVFYSSLYEGKYAQYFLDFLGNMARNGGGIFSVAPRDAQGNANLDFEMVVPTAPRNPSCPM